MTPAYAPVGRPQLRQQLVAAIVSESALVVRVAVDGPECAEPGRLAAELVEPLRVLGRPTHLIDARTFWRDASLRLEYGHQDPDSYLSWLDAGALRREVLDRVGEDGQATFLPSLRDPLTNRATRADPVPAEAGSVVIVFGALLLGLGLPFDLTVHLALTPGALARRTTPALQWTLPALARYDEQARPRDHSDLVVRWDDPEHPALRVG